VLEHLGRGSSDLLGARRWAAENCARAWRPLPSAHINRRSSLEGKMEIADPSLRAAAPSQ